MTQVPKTLLLIFILITDTLAAKTTSEQLYEKTFDELCAMLKGEQKPSFKRAVFITENAFLDNEMNYNKFCKVIEKYKAYSEEIIASRDLLYSFKDKRKVSVYASVYSIMKDTTITSDSSNLYYHLPFTYNFDDFAGEKDWTNMFVTKMLTTHKGNCHSMPLLYKILVEELGEEAWLALAPNHLYIKLKNEKFGWYNTELTSGIFPIDSWLVASGYIHLDAIRNGLYMDTLSLKQSIGLCLTDLAKGYERKFGKGDCHFILKCCDMVLTYYPNYINALLQRAETLKTLYLSETDKNTEQSKQLETSMTEAYSKIYKLGYRKMPKEMYFKWLSSITEQKDSYENKNIIKFRSK